MVCADELENDSKENVPANMQEPQLFTVEILKIIKDAQQQHGLRHSDFQRYRGYCTRRIRRLRKTLHLPQGDKRHFKRRDVTESILKDERYLFIPLMLSERAWAYAMQLRQEANTEPRKKFHLISRLRKAATHAQQLHTLCQSPLCDARSKLEAQAYLASITGTLEFELHMWKEAMDKFKEAQVVYEKLCGAVDEVDQAVYKHKCEELVPNLRYCAYNIGDSSAISDLKSLHSIAQGDLLENLESLMAKARDKQGVGVQEVNWRGRRLTVRPQSIGMFLSEEQELGPPPASPPPPSDLQAEIDSLERHIIRCKDAVAVARDEINNEQNGKTKSGISVSQMQDLLNYLTHIRLARSNQRTLLMIEAAKLAVSEQSSQSGEKEAPEGRKVKPQDLIRLYEMILQNLSEMEQLPGLENDSEYQTDLNAMVNAYKAFRCYYIAEVLTSTKRFREALALYDKAIGYTSTATSIGISATLSQQLEELVNSVESAKCICLAQAVLQSTDEPGPSSSATSPVGEKKPLTKVPLIERLDEYKEDPKMVKQPNLIRLPPEMKPIPCKPLFFDVAMNHLTFPPLDDILEKKQQQANPQGLSGFVKGLWGWGSGNK